MRLPALAVAACGLVTATIAVAQISTRPNQIRIAPAPVHPQANTAGGDGRVAAQIGELQAQITALDKRLGQSEAKLAATQNALTNAQTTASNAIKTIAGLDAKVNKLIGLLGTTEASVQSLRTDFMQHNHFYRDFHEEAGKLKKFVLGSSRPSTYCQMGSGPGEAPGGEWHCAIP